jgi:hypothetical protein
MILFNKVNWNFLIRTPFVYKLKGRFILLNRPFYKPDRYADGVQASSNLNLALK